MRILAFAFLALAIVLATIVGVDMYNSYKYPDVVVERFYTIEEESAPEIDTPLTMYIIYTGVSVLEDGTSSHTVMMFKTRDEAVNYCNADPISPMCYVFEARVDGLEPCTRDKNGEVIEWGRGDIDL